MKNILLASCMALASAASALSQEVSLQSAPPVVVKAVPPAGATNVDPALTELRVTFSKAMRDGSWSWSTWGEENFPELAGQPRYLADGRTCVVPVKLKAGKFYATWLNSDKFKGFADSANVPAVPYLLTFRTREAEAGTPALAAVTTPPTAASILERQIDKLVADFPGQLDLSTPESACAAWQRASARKDAKAISQLSWVPLDPKEQEDWYRREETRDSEGLAVYLKAVADSKIVVVQTWKGELANVITRLSFPPGQGASPFSTRFFGRIGEEWKNLGEDRLPNLEAAKANFERKKEAIGRQFEDVPRGKRK